MCCIVNSLVFGICVLWKLRKDAFVLFNISTWRKNFSTWREKTFKLEEKKLFNLEKRNFSTWRKITFQLEERKENCLLMKTNTWISSTGGQSSPSISLKIETELDYIWFHGKHWPIKDYGEKTFLLSNVIV